MLEDNGHGVLLVHSLLCLRRLLFTHLRPENVESRLYAFRSALFCLGVILLISFIFSYLESFFVGFYLSLYFILAQKASARDQEVLMLHQRFNMG